MFPNLIDQVTGTPLRTPCPSRTHHAVADGRIGPRRWRRPLQRIRIPPLAVSLGPTVISPPMRASTPASKRSAAQFRATRLVRGYAEAVAMSESLAGTQGRSDQHRDECRD